ncbi:brachyurin-like [Zophobas morio]|uniref:brachyurin-like n=1 Tax=Zophobas morio TaxID=2755281 RepID=UPI003083D165
MKSAILLLCLFTLSINASFIQLPRVTLDKKTIKNARIIGGQVASPGQFPWQVAIYKNTTDGRFFCGGAIINEQWILTAAQCVYAATQLTIQLGSNQLQGSDDGRVTITSSTYFYEPRFDPTLGVAHDIALIKIEEPLTFTDYVQPIGWAYIGRLYPGKVVTASGWGQVSDADSTLENDLSYVEMTVFDQIECQAYYGSQLEDTMICTVGTTNQGTCYGDIGGVLVTKALDWLGDFTVAVAISSWMSQNGCESSDPKGFTRIDAYISWIVNTTRDN